MMAAFALRDLVFVVRENEIEAAAVDVECLTQQFLAHCRAFDVPPRSAVAPRALPGWLARLGCFPQREVGYVPLPLAAGAAFALHRFDRAVRKLAVLRVL